MSVCRICSASSRRLTGWSVSLATTTVWSLRYVTLCSTTKHHGIEEEEPMGAQTPPCRCLAADWPKKWRMEQMEYRLA